MNLGTPRPFVEAYEFAENRKLLPTRLSSRELEELPVQIRTQAVFSAGVTEAEILDMVREETALLVKGVSPGPGVYYDKPSFRLKLKKLIAAMGYEPETKDAGTIKDLRTDARLNLIIDMQIALARGFGQHKQQTTPAALLMFPCWELVRVAPRRVPRGWRLIGAIIKQVDPNYWRNRFVKAGGELRKGRMVALKSDPVWAALSRFGVPWPPFDYNSGMGLRQINGREAMELGVTEGAGRTGDTERGPSGRGQGNDGPKLTDGLQAKVGGMEEQLRSSLASILGPLYKVGKTTAGLR